MFALLCACQFKWNSGVSASSIAPLDEPPSGTIIVGSFHTTVSLSTADQHHHHHHQQQQHTPASACASVENGGATTTSTRINDELFDQENDCKRFQIELEFVQLLANPNYLNYLAQRGYFRQDSFLNYLKYLTYRPTASTSPAYCKYLAYPQCLALFELLQREQFLKDIVNVQCAKFVDEQLLLIWLHYKKRHDWIRVGPTRVPPDVEKLFAAVTNSNDKTHFAQAVKKQQNQQPQHQIGAGDAFSASRFVQNEKF